MANPPHFPTIPLAEHFGHDINHNTPPVMEIRTGSLTVQYHSYPSRCSRWRHIRGDTGHLAISCGSGFLSSYFSVCQVTMKDIRYNGTALPSDNMHHHEKNLFRMITIILALFIRLLSVLFHIPVPTVPVFIRSCILRHPHQRPADRAAQSCPVHTKRGKRGTLQKCRHRPPLRHSTDLLDIEITETSVINDNPGMWISCVKMSKPPC